MSRGRGPGLLLNSLQSTGQLLAAKDLWPHSVSSAKAGRPAQSTSRHRALAPLTEMALVVDHPGEPRRGHHASSVFCGSHEGLWLRGNLKKSLENAY